jgi:hypothetical protein
MKHRLEIFITHVPEGEIYPLTFTSSAKQEGAQPGRPE